MITFEQAQQIALNAVKDAPNLLNDELVVANIGQENKDYYSLLIGDKRWIVDNDSSYKFDDDTFYLVNKATGKFTEVSYWWLQSNNIVLTDIVETTKGLRVDADWKQNVGVPSVLEIQRAKSRLEILPNPPIPNIDDPEKYVESPWEIVATPTVDPNLWDNAVLELVNFEDLFATDPFLSRKKIRKHIDVIGQAVTPFRSHALIAVVGDRYTIIDGHHRLMSQWLIGQQKAPAWVIRLKEEN